MGLAEPTKQSSSKNIDDKKDIRVSAVKGKKITTIIANIIPAGGKLLMASTKMTLLEAGQDMNMKKI